MATQNPTHGEVLEKRQDVARRRPCVGMHCRWQQASVWHITPDVSARLATLADIQVTAVSLSIAEKQKPMLLHTS